MPGGFLEKSESVTTTKPALVVIFMCAHGAVKSIFLRPSDSSGRGGRFLGV
jgi:hypothetical protein